jgi:hypothetical protein
MALPGTTITSGTDTNVGGDVVGRDKVIIYQNLASPPRTSLTVQSPIIAASHNAHEIESDFLGWPQCTLMLWVFVPPRGRALRDSLYNRYLLAHNTGETRTGVFYNQFSLRHCSARGYRGRWEVQFSNSRATYPNRYLTIEDSLRRGWSHFLIAWDHIQHRALQLLVNLGRNGGKTLRSYYPYWPKKLSDTVCVGAWTPDEADDFYCETSLFQLWICDRLLQPNDPVVLEHFSMKPS